MTRLISLLLVSTIAAVLALLLVRGLQGGTAETPAIVEAESHRSDRKLREAESTLVARSIVSGDAVRLPQAASTHGSQPTTESGAESRPQPGYLFDLEGLRSLLESGLVGVENQEGRILSGADIDEIMVEMRLGLDQAQMFHDAIMADPSKPNYASGRAMAGTWELVAAILPESVDLLRQGKILTYLRAGKNSDFGIQNSANIQQGDLTMIVMGPRWSLTMTVPHTVGPRAIWRERYEFERRNGSLPARMLPSSVPGAGTLVVSELLGESR